jgi:hypothetical protein
VRWGSLQQVFIFFLLFSLIFSRFRLTAPVSVLGQDDDDGKKMREYNVSNTHTHTITKKKSNHNNWLHSICLPAFCLKREKSAPSELSIAEDGDCHKSLIVTLIDRFGVRPTDRKNIQTGKSLK